jgi:type II secretory pathway component HofQ
VKGKVTVELRDVPWDAALVTILRTHGLAAEVDGRIVSVAPQPPAA